ncbi:hypothetical protein COK19_12760 [Bacillus cereus]|uniref:DHH family phosphoesterase n=1 Tax=Bacillus cereus TaxID=1396 RepID=UPI000BF344E4|nr:DHH family phosphoesterase [Bacillus cereus]PFR26491.1 hypothetical protein COK19_12760 [Bacillus cereus]
MNKWIAMSHPLDQHPHKKWIYYLSRQFDVSPVLIYHLYIQGFTSKNQLEDYFYPNISHLHNPFLMNEMEHAVQRIMKAIMNKERIVIFGDYDCGATRS